MIQKEELRKKFLETCCYKEMESESVRYPSEVFDFFYAEIEKLQASEDELCLKVQKEQDEAVRIYNEGEERDKMRSDKISHLHSTLEAAEKVIERSSYDWNKGHSGVYLEALEKYNQLKTKSQS